MSTPTVEIAVPDSQSVTVTKAALSVELADGRTISVPLGWYPGLLHSSPEERSNWRLIARGRGIQWEDIDEDISIAGLLAGQPSGESQSSFKKWLASRSSRPAKRPSRRR